MGVDPTRVLDRAVNRVKRWSRQVRERVDSLPVRSTHRGLPLPPGRLLHTVANSADVSWFLGGGAAAADTLVDVLAHNGVAIDHLGVVLDFGCGVGRVLRHFAHLDGPTFHGTDYNPELIAWCTRNLPFARFQINRLDGRLSYNDASFDLIYALSVFTHLGESGQRFWINELTRVLKPQGHLFITTHGEHYLPQLSAVEQDRFREGHLVVLGAMREGSNDCAVFHPEPYVRQTLARSLDVIDFIPEGARGNPWQDVYLLRKP